MSWIGAAVGAGVGFFIGGPIGGAAGGAVGHWLSTDDADEEQELQALSFYAIFAMAGKIAKADGRVSPEEIALVDDVIKSKMELDEEDRKAAIEMFNAAKSDEHDIDDYARLYAAGQDDGEVREIVYRMLFDIAHADGVFHPSEEQILRRLPSALNLPPSLYKLVLDEGSHLAQCYEVLGCSPEHTDDEVRRAYRTKAKDFHPDKLMSKGLPEGFVKYADEQMKRINDAYSRIMAHRAA